MINLNDTIKLNFSDGCSLKFTHTPKPISYDRNNILGYIIYEVDRDNSRYFIHRLVITGKNQKEGYLTKAIEKLFNEFKQKKEYKNIVINIKKTRKKIIEFVEKIGFKYNGEYYIYEIETNLSE